VLLVPIFHKRKARRSNATSSYPAEPLCADDSGQWDCHIAAPLPNVHHIVFGKMWDDYHEPPTNPNHPSNRLTKHRLRFTTGVDVLPSRGTSIRIFPFDLDQIINFENDHASRLYLLSIKMIHN
jgi:hypothetical protein